jgi:2,3-bisphosphoglycerate-independent phosphoglycerate mutase
LLGLVGEGGVHAHTRHLVALLEAAKRAGARDVVLHAFTDGRDAPPTSAPAFLADVERAMARLGVGRVGTMSGRYWAMDRDNRWDRTERAWRAIVDGAGLYATSVEEAIAAAYARGETDEFISPTVIAPPGGEPTTVAPGDAVVMFNFRADRMRQLLWAFTEPERTALPVERIPGLALATMTDYGKDGQLAQVAFASTPVTWPLARVISEAGLAQLHTAETEKYAHVTYFFNGGAEAPFEGEERVLVPSPKVATYDLAPEMSARPLTDTLVDSLALRRHGFVIVNFANPDMVGHTGSLPAAIKAVEVTDECLGRVLAAVEAAGGAAVVTADHGNCETMIDPATGGPHTAHTTNPTPCFIVGPGLTSGGGARVRDGRLSDVAPTIVSLMGLTRPDSMTGECLLAGWPSPVAEAV